MEVEDAEVLLKTLTLCCKKTQEKLVNHETEEFSKSIPETKKTAVDFGDNWLMCPACQESWEENSEKKRLNCPKCKRILLNPFYKS